MDFLFDNQREERLFEGFLSERLQGAPDRDKQFAKPIEDEDLFGLDNFITNETENLEVPSNDEYLGSNDPIFSGALNDEVLDDNCNTENICPEDDQDELDRPFSGIAENKPVELDDIFIDDYSADGFKDSDPIASISSVENTYTGNVKKLPEPSPAQIKLKLMKERLLKQANEMNLNPKKIASGLEKDGEFEVVIDQKSLVSDTNSKFIFNKVFDRSKKAKTSPESDKRSWNSYKNSLKKKICAQKRKIWDAFQHPVDAFDDEEEFIEKPDDDDNVDNDLSDEEKDGDVELSNSPPALIDESQGNFEDLEREDAGSDISDTKSTSEQEEEDIEARDSPCSSADEDMDADEELDAESSHLKHTENDKDDESLLSEDYEEQLITEPTPKDDIKERKDDESDDEVDYPGGDFRLDLDDNSIDTSENVKRRVMFIDDED